MKRGREAEIEVDGQRESVGNSLGEGTQSQEATASEY